MILAETVNLIRRESVLSTELRRLEQAWVSSCARSYCFRGGRYWGCRDQAGFGNYCLEVPFLRQFSY